jgi:hypothetical protein
LATPSPPPTVAIALLHGSLDNRTLSPSAAADGVAILASHSEAAPGWADSLESMIHSDPRTRDAIWMVVSLALSCLADPRVLDAVTPRPGAIWDASIMKIILGGTSTARDLQDLSALIDERDEHTDTISIGDYGSRPLQRSTRGVPVMPPETIRTLPFGTASCCSGAHHRWSPVFGHGRHAPAPNRSTRSGPPSSQCFADADPDNFCRAPAVRC